MPSLIPGYNHDIFISYRQKDNKGEKWVSNFVDSLKTELESTFKEEISVYFDINPHDGLLETHDVDESLKEKLKCLVFIPIISRTYCDPKSFAWEHEFKAFVELASKDQFGLKIKLPNGNVTSRVLPVQIHDLNPEDKILVEKVLGGHLRAIEFIYKEPGVNKPLTSEDDEKKNLNGTKYRIQINKVANAIDEIIINLKNLQTVPIAGKTRQQESMSEYEKGEKLEFKDKPFTTSKRKVISIAIILMILFVIVGILAYPRLFHSNKSKTDLNHTGKISIVVNRFDNKTIDATMDPWCAIIPDMLRGYLATSKEISVQNSQTMIEVYKSINQTKKTSFKAFNPNEAALRLESDYYVMGSFQKINDKTLIVVNIVNTHSGEILKTINIDGNLDSDYKIMTDSLSMQTKNFLEIKALEKNANLEYGEAFTNSVEAYRKYVEGMKLIMNGNNNVAVKALEESYRIDTTFTLAAFYLSFAYCHFDWTQARIWALKAYRGKEKLPEDFRMWLEFWRAWFNTQNTNDVLNYCNSIMNSETKSRFILYDIGVAYLYLGKYDNSVKMFEKVEKVSSERGEKWDYLPFYTFFADACNRAGIYDKESQVLENGLILFPDDIELIWSKARLLISKGDTKKATELILKYRRLSKHSGTSESGIENRIGTLFEEANRFDQAEEHYRTALKLDPSNYSIMTDLAYFLVNHDRNIEEAQALVKIVLDNDPNNLDALYAEATIRLKEGKFQEAVDLLQDVKDSTLWVPTIIKVDQQISEAKKAVANQKAI